MLRNDHSDHKRFIAFAGTSAKSMAQKITDCCEAFGVPKRLISEGPTIFKTKSLVWFEKG